MKQNKVWKRLLVGVLSASVVLTSGLGTLQTQAAITTPDDLEPILFKVDNVTAQPGETVKLNVNSSLGSGFSAARAEVLTSEGIEVSKVARGDFAGTMMYSTSSKNFIYLSSDGCNVYGDGVLAKLKIDLPEDIEPGKYTVDLNVDQVAYAYEDLSGQTLYSQQKIKTTAGSITVPMTYTKNYVFLVDSKEIEAGQEDQVDLYVKNPTGFNYLNASFETEGGIEITNLESEYGLTKYSNGKGAFVDSQLKNSSVDGTFAKLSVKVPANTPAGEYKIKMNVDKLSYAYENGTGQEDVPDKYISTVVGTIIVPGQSVEPTPEVTPTAEPTPEVTPTAEPTPEVTPTAEPTPEVTPTAEPTPEVTPTAEPTPEVTPTAEPTPEVTPTAEPTPVVPAKTDLTVTSTVNNWGSGYQVLIKVSNDTDKIVDGWELKISKDDISIDAIWSVNITEENGYYVITPVEWNKTLAPGASTEFGIQGSGSASDTVKILVNGNAAINPVDPVEPVDPVDPVDPDDPVDPVNPVDPSAKIVTISNVSFDKTIDLSVYDYKAIKQIVIKFSGSAQQYSGAVVLGEWVQQVSFDNSIVSNNTLTVDVTSPQAILNIRKWYSNSSLEIESIELVY